MLFITSDRGMNGAYSSNVIKTVAGVRQRLHDEGKEIVRYVVGRKGIGFLKYRGLPIEAHWEGFSDAPTYDRAVEISDRLLEDFLKPTEEGGVDEIWAVYTRMESMLTQTPRVRRLLPLEVVEGVQEPTDPERPSRCTCSSRIPRRCWTRCCRSTSAAVSGSTCCSRQRPSWPASSGR